MDETIVSPHTINIAHEHITYSGKATADQKLESRLDDGALLCNALLISRHDWSFVDALLSKGKDYSGYTDNYGKNLLHYAIRANAPVRVVNELIKKGVSVNQADYDGWTSLHLCIRLHKSCDISVAKCLLDHGANPNVKDKLGETPVLMAAHFAVPNELLLLLLETGGDPNTKNEDGETPLIIAAREGKWALDAIRSLVSYGANPLVRDSTGRNALDWAREKGHEHIVKVMRQTWYSRTN